MKIPQSLIDAFGYCEDCKCEKDILHVSEIENQQVEMLATMMTGTKDCFVVFCPECEDMGFVKE